jgi:hypothetical protein
VVELIDVHERIARFLPILQEMVGDGLVTTEPVHVVTYRGSPSSD